MSLHIVIDSRERHKQYFLEKLKAQGLEVKIEKLPAGDFLIFGGEKASSVLIERKTATDFMSSLFQNRIFDQLKRMKETETKPLILIEGSLTAPRKWMKVNVNSICGALASIIWGWQVPIINLPSRSWAVSFLVSLAKRAGGIKKPFAIHSSPAKSMSLREKQGYLLQSLPGIGAKLSEEILSTYTVPFSFFEAVKQNSVSIKGLGKKTLREVHAILMKEASE